MKVAPQQQTVNLVAPGIHQHLYMYLSVKRHVTQRNYTQCIMPLISSELYQPLHMICITTDKSNRKRISKKKSKSQFIAKYNYKDFALLSPQRVAINGAIICRGFEPGLSRSRVRHSAAEPRRLHNSMALPYLFQIVSPPPRCSFLSYGLLVVTRDVHRSSLRRSMCLAQYHFIFFTFLI